MIKLPQICSFESCCLCLECVTLVVKDVSGYGCRELRKATFLTMKFDVGIVFYVRAKLYVCELSAVCWQ